MADSKPVKKWELFYDEKHWTSFHSLFLIEVTDDDRGNEAFLKYKYKEADLPRDPITRLIGALNDREKTAFEALVATKDDNVPTKLQLLKDPDKYFAIFQKLLDESAIPANKIQVYQANNTTRQALT